MRFRFRGDIVRHRLDVTRLAAVGIIAVTTLAAACGSSNTRSVRVTVPAGSSFATAVDSLARAGIIASPRLFRFYASARGRDRDLKAGTYVFEPGSSWNDVLDALTRGKGLVHTVTIPEGFSLASIAQTIGRALAVPPESLVEAATDSAIRRRLDVPTPTLEGYLFPDTYTFAAGTTPDEVVRMLVTRFERVWKPEWNARLEQLAMSRHDILTLASIIEKEARLAEERPVISAVYHNRLKIGMLLQADPTVQYAVAKERRALTRADLTTDHPYNTYTRRGLPPGPIASPGLGALQAAVDPAPVSYLYFVARDDRRHTFSTSVAEHNRAVLRYRLTRRAL